MLNLHHLAVFHAVATASSISRGADQLMISQPAVSKQLRLLERNVGAILFDRHSKGVSLTAAGRVLADYATRIFAMAADAERAMEDVTSLRRGRLSIGGGPTVGVYLLPIAMVRFRQQYPLIQLHAETAAADVLTPRLIDGMLDFAITESLLESSELQSKILMHDVLVPVAAKSLSKKSEISATEFCRQPFIARETESGNKSLVERTLESRGLTIHPVLTVGSTEAIKQAVIAGLGVAMVSRLAIRAEVAAGLLAEIPAKGLRIRYPIYQAWRRRTKQSVAASAFLKLLLESVA